MNPVALKNFFRLSVMLLLGSFLAVAFVVLSFSVAYGFDETVKAFLTGMRNLGKIEEVAGINTLNQSLLTSDISSMGDEAYRGIDITDYQVKPLKFDLKTETALVIPTTGIAAHPDFLYHETTHPGVDIWTSVDGKGLNGTSKGSPVYAACSGKIIRVFQPNEEIEIDCDLISQDYRNSLPSLDIKVLYSHMGNGITKERYHNLKPGQRVTKGEFVGFQGNISSFVPENTVTHLHFGVYDMPTSKPLDPSPYVGFSSIRLGQTFEALK